MIISSGTHAQKKPFQRKSPDLSLTIGKGGDVSQVLSADLCNVLHHEDLPRQLIQEVSCHKWCFAGEHNLLMETSGKGRTGVIETSEQNLQNTCYLKKRKGKFIAWNHRISLTSNVSNFCGILWSWLMCIVISTFNLCVQIQTPEYPFA